MGDYLSKGLSECKDRHHVVRDVRGLGLLQGIEVEMDAKMVVGDVIGLGRAGTLVDWEAEAEQRAYAVFYRAEQIINWCVERVNGRNVPTLVVLRETAEGAGIANSQSQMAEDDFGSSPVEQIRVLRLVAGDNGDVFCRVDVWQEKVIERSWLGFGRQKGKRQWVLVDSRVPRRLGKPLPLIPFVFHGPRHSRPDVDRGPLEDIIAVNLDHYRLDADFKHGLHFTALPTAWVSGFDKGASLRIGSIRIPWASTRPSESAKGSRSHPIPVLVPQPHEGAQDLERFPFLFRFHEARAGRNGARQLLNLDRLPRLPGLGNAQPRLGRDFEMSGGDLVAPASPGATPHLARASADAGASPRTDVSCRFECGA